MKVHLTCLSFLILSSAEARLPKPLALDYNELKKEVRAREIKTIEEFLPQLPIKLRKNVTFVHSSNSPQEASLSSPRAILFGIDGKFILTFNGNSKQRKGLSIEVIQFKENDGKPRFELFEILFDPNGDKNAKFSQINPPKCLSCHLRDPKPIWGNYNEFDGVFGASDSIKVRLDKESNLSQDFIKFSKSARSHPRYKAIDWPEDDFSWPYSYPEDGDIRFDRIPNLRLTTALTVLQAKKVSSRLLDFPVFKYLKNTFLYTSNCSIPTADGLKLKSWLHELYPDTEPMILKPDNEFFSTSEIHEKMSLRYSTIRDSRPGYDVKMHQLDVRRIFGIQNNQVNLRLAYSDNSQPTASGLFMNIESMIDSILLSKRGFYRDEVVKASRRNDLSFFDEDQFIGVSEWLNFIFDSGVTFAKHLKRNQNYCEKIEASFKSEINNLPPVASLLSRMNEKDFQKINSVRDSLNTSPFYHQGKNIIFKTKCLSCHSTVEPKSYFNEGPFLPFTLDEEFRKSVKIEYETKESFLKKLEWITSSQAPSFERMPLLSPNLSVEERSQLIDFTKSQLKEFN